MITILKNHVAHEITHILVDAEVRYYEDTTINGVEDVNVMDTEGMVTPNIPCVERIADKPTKHICSDCFRWRPKININTGQIENWTQGLSADVHYKVCDQGVYHLLDKDGNTIKTIESQVPDVLYPGGDGCGDYIIMDIDSDGYIMGFEFKQSDLDAMIKNDFNS